MRFFIFLLPLTFSNGFAPNDVIHQLSQDISLPFEFKYRKSIIRIKHLEKEKVTKAVSLCLQEYGSYTFQNNMTPLDKKIQAKINDVTNFILSFVILLGLGQRVERLEKVMSDPNEIQDHNVICIYKVDQNQKEHMMGLAEVSLQPPDPAHTAPPFVLPSHIKNAFSKIGIWKTVQPYISNVLITNEYRGKGYSKLLMTACEGICRKWGYDNVYLHVSAEARSSKAAQNLYKTLGYMPVVDKTYNKHFGWMGVDVVNWGLYVVDGAALLFLKKELK